MPREWLTWQALIGLVGTYLVLYVGVWVLAGQYLWAAVTGRPDPVGSTDRLLQWAVGLGCAAFGVLLTWLAHRFIRRHG